MEKAGGGGGEARSHARDAVMLALAYMNFVCRLSRFQVIKFKPENLIT